MALTFDTENLVIESTASITDLPAFHAELRDWEDSEEGVIWPVTHTWKALDLGGGAFMYQADLTNGWSLKFPTAGNYTINGNLNGTIQPVAGVYVERKTSAAYVTTAIGGSGPSASDIAAAILAASVETGATVAESLRLSNAVLGGKVSGAGTGTETFRNLADTKDRLVVTVDSSGNRTALTRDLT